MDNKQLLIAIVSVIVLIVSVMVIVRTVRRPGPRYRPELDECLGAKMGEATVKLLSGQGDVVVLSWAGSQADNEAMKIQMKGFDRAIAAYPGIKVVGRESPAGDDEAPGLGGIQKPLVERIMNQYPRANALVSFLGVPNLNGAYGELDQSKVPAVVALSVGQFERWQELIGSSIRATIVRNRNALEQSLQTPVQPPLAAQACDDFILVSNGTQP